MYGPRTYWVHATANHSWTSGRYIQANVTDPNSYSITQGSYNKTVPAGLQGINCEARWYRGESPEGRTWPCNSVEQGHFALQVLPGTGASAGVSDFKLVFIHQLEAPPLSVFKRYQATSSFKAGDNLNTGCSASGWCSYRLEPAREYPLQHVQPKTVADNCTTCS